MREFNTVVSENGRVIIPAVIRRELELEPGDKLTVTLSKENEIIFHSQKKSLKRLQDIFKASGKKGLVDEVIKMRRKEKI